MTHNLLKGKHILYVEDDEFLVKLIQGKLEASGAIVTNMKSAETALEAIREETFDGLLLDLLLPHKSGLDLVEELCKEQPLFDVPVVVFSNLGQEQHLERARELGVDRYIVKANVVPAEIPDVLAEVIGEYDEGNNSAADDGDRGDVEATPSAGTEE